MEIALDLLASHRPEALWPAGLAGAPSHESPAVVAGGLVYISGQMALGRCGPDPRGLPDPSFPDLHVPEAEQLKLVLERVELICRAAGTGGSESAARLEAQSASARSRSPAAW